MEEKNKNKLPLATAIFVAAGALMIFVGVKGASSAMGILSLLIGAFLVFAGIYGYKHAKVANELLTTVNNDPDYAHDKEVLECLEGVLQSIKDKLPEDPSARDGDIIAKKMGDPQQLIAFGKKSIEKGALMVLSTHNRTDTRYSWHVFTDHIYAYINGGPVSLRLDQSLDVFPSNNVFDFRCDKEAIEENVTYKTDASVGGRAAAGAALAGPAGAVVGAISAANKNNTGGVTKTKRRIAGYNYYIQFKNEDVDVICISEKALGEKRGELKSFLNFDMHLRDSSDDIVLNLKKYDLNKDKKYKLTSILSDIRKNISHSR